MPSLVEIGLMVPVKKIFHLVNVFSLVVIISPWKKALPFIWTNLNPFTQGYFAPSLFEIVHVV